MYLTIVVGILQLAAVVCLYSFGIFPMLIAYLAVNFVGLLICQYYVNKQIGLRLFAVLKDISTYLTISLACFSVAWLVTKNMQNLYWIFGTKIVLSAVLYVLALKVGRSTIFRESTDYIRQAYRKREFSRTP